MPAPLESLNPHLAWLIVLAGAALLGLAGFHILWFVIRRVVRHTQTTIDNLLLEHCSAPCRVLLPVLAVHAAANLAPDTELPGYLIVLRGVLDPVAIGTLAWLLIRILTAVEKIVLQRYSLEAADNLRARRIHTQMRVLRRIVVVIVIVLATAAVLLNYESFRQIGTGILASAGLAGLIVGLAAQRTLANLLAGFQIAITQPIRLDDVVIVEGEWGRIEEITLTYVVIQIWDLRRLVVPISYFIEKPFENWTRVSADLLGTVYLHLDYSVPVEEIRKVLDGILQESEHWDGKVQRIHVTGSSERTMEVRALMSAPDSGAAWELRTQVREKLIRTLSDKYPGCLPRVRLVHPDRDPRDGPRS